MVDGLTQNESEKDASETLDTRRKSHRGGKVGSLAIYSSESPLAAGGLQLSLAGPIVAHSVTRSL
jgi:hypothetical protein